MRLARSLSSLLLGSLVVVASTAGATQLFVTTPAGIREFDPVTLTDVGLFAPAPAGVSWDPNSIIQGPGSGDLYVANSLSGAVYRFDRDDGSFLGTFVTSYRPYEIEFGPNGDLYVLGRASSTTSYLELRRYDGTTGAFIGTTVSSLDGFTFGPDGYLYVSQSQPQNGFIERRDPSSGALLGVVATAPPPSDNDLWLGGWGGELAFTPDGGSIIGVAQNTSLGEPALGRFDLATGQLVAESLASYFWVSPNDHLVPGPDGYFYVPLDDNADGKFVRFDAYTLQQDGDGDMLFGVNPDHYASAMLFVPEPRVACLVALGASAVAFGRRRARC